MSELHDVRRRIQKRQGESPRKHNGIFKLCYRMMMLVMGIAIAILAFFINDKIGLVKLPENLKNINFGMVSEWIPFENWFSLEDETVSAAPSYTLLKENQYANGSNQANSIGDGVVLHVEMQSGKKGSVTIRHDNGVVATYGHLDSVSVKADERLLKDKALGSFSEFVSIDLLKDNKIIDLATALGGS